MKYKSKSLKHLNPKIMTDDEKLDVPTMFFYSVKKSNAVKTRNYWYVTEIEIDGFGETERAITKALSIKELIQLRNDLSCIIEAEYKRLT